ncbi:MAG: glycosyltransferase [Deltaproteobacteria bacterium]|nr:glycosyltransferase [Deltaproteobacteria bacterium]
MRLLFFYLAHRNAGYYLDFLLTEGYYWLLKRMVETGIIDEVSVIIESGQKLDPIEYMDGLTGHVVGGIENTPVREGDIIWVRGGWKSWFPHLEKLYNEKHWLLFYAANTGRERWPFWDVIFDDLNGKDFLDAAGRVHLDFRKPTNPEIFRPMDMERKYDLCIGASHIHDKKGQWRGVQAAIAYQQIFGKKLKCIMPGAFRRGVKTNNIIADIKQYHLDIELPGMLPREELVRILNGSKVFAHLGSGGQGDRGVMEAMRCGCPVMIGFPRYHAPFTYETDLSYVTADPDHFSTLAYEINEQIEQSTEEKRRRVFEYHEVQCGLEAVILPRMKRLFSFFRNYPQTDKKALWEEFNGEESCEL